MSAEASIAASGAAEASGRWDTVYERKAVFLMAAGFALVGVDRWVLAQLAAFSPMPRDLHLTPQSIGNLLSILAVTWGIAAFFLGNLSDAAGRKRVLVPALVVFSLLSGFSGLAAGFGSMLLIRALMGGAEGAFCTTSFAVVSEASKPSRRGSNMGLQQSIHPLLALGFGPIITAYLLDYMDWRWVFAIVGVPGLIVAGWVAFAIREPATIVARRAANAAGGVGHVRIEAPKLSLSQMFRHRNVALGMACVLCAMCGMFVMSAFVPMYLTTFLKFDAKTAGAVSAAIGFGGFVGLWGLPTLSDIIGRRTGVVVGFVLAAVALYAFTRLGADNKVLLFALLFVSAGVASGTIGLITGPIAAEAAPLGMIAGTSGAIVAVGEIFGGGVAPSLGGFIAQNFGIANTLWLALGGLVLGVVISLFLKETAPRLAKAGAGTESALDVYEDQHPEGIAGAT